ncbi:recombinase family protein [Roseobacter sp. EG26]|uniref:recombinase family protein n=1 Tax=Roseobacter sp. EG26 TaxID=3412477 RepID=UPI003CE4E38B
MVFEHEGALRESCAEVNKSQGIGQFSGDNVRSNKRFNQQIERDPFRSHSAPRRYGYIRVSTSAQQTDRQVMQLEAECDELRVEHISAVASERPVFDALLADLDAGDTFIVVDLDRAFRSAIDAIITSEALRKRHVRFQILSFPFDTTSDEGELFFGIVALFAQFERRIIGRRTREGMEAARKRGIKLGRPARLDAETIVSAYDWMVANGLPCAYVSALLGVSRLTLQRSFRREGLAYPVES